MLENPDYLLNLLITTQKVYEYTKIFKFLELRDTHFMLYFYVVKVTRYRVWTPLMLRNTALGIIGSHGQNLEFPEIITSRAST